MKTNWEKIIKFKDSLESTELYDRDKFLGTLIIGYKIVDVKKEFYLIYKWDSEYEINPHPFASLKQTKEFVEKNYADFVKLAKYYHTFRSFSFKLGNKQVAE